MARLALDYVSGNIIDLYHEFVDEVNCVGEFEVSNTNDTLLSNLIQCNANSDVKRKNVIKSAVSMRNKLNKIIFAVERLSVIKKQQNDYAIIDMRNDKIMFFKE